MSYQLWKCSISCVALTLGMATAEAATTTYKYDALGRLVRLEISGGAQHGVRRSFQYDAAGNRERAWTGSWLATEITPTKNVLTFMGSGDVVLTVNVGGTAATGMVSFYFDGQFYGAAPVVNGVANIGFQSVAPGNYTVTATYSGDDFHEANSVTFDVTVRDLSWLPSVLDLILE